VGEPFQNALWTIRRGSDSSDSGDSEGCKPCAAVRHRSVGAKKVYHSRAPALPPIDAMPEATEAPATPYGCSWQPAYTPRRREKATPGFPGAKGLALAPYPRWRNERGERAGMSLEWIRRSRVRSRRDG
jgi:hypothetical protein